jgi:DNA ligase-1
MNNTLYPALDALKSLQESNTKIRKESVLKSLPKRSIYFLKVLLNNECQLGLKKLNIKHSKDDNLTFNEVYNLIEKLKLSNINDSLRDEVVKLLMRVEPQYLEMMAKIFTKTLKVGVTAKTVNKIYPKLIPEFKVMLADTSSDIQFPAYLETKYDGVRCVTLYDHVTDNVQMFTRQGKPIYFSRIADSIKKTFKNVGSFMLDGELEDMTGVRTNTSGIVNSNIHSGYRDDHDISLKYTVFDIMSKGEFDTETCQDPLSKRKTLLSSLIDDSLANLQTAYTVLVNNIEEVLKINKEHIEKGLEGVIVKDPKEKYLYKRSKSWAKFKAINSCTLVVTGVTEGTNKRIDKIGALVCQSQDGLVKVNVGSGLTDEDLEVFTNTPPIGKFVEVIYNMVEPASKENYTLFLPRFKELRVDKTEADTYSKIIEEQNNG